MMSWTVYVRVFKDCLCRDTKLFILASKMATNTDENVVTSLALEKKLNSFLKNEEPLSKTSARVCVSLVFMML